MKRYVEAGYTKAGYIVGDGAISTIPIQVKANTPRLIIKKYIHTPIISLHITTKFNLLTTKHIEKIDINLSLKEPHRNIAKKLGYGTLRFNINSFGYKKIDTVTKVVRLNGITFTYPLSYFKGLYNNDYIAESILAIDGSSIVNVLKRGKFATPILLKGEFISENELIKLKNIISNDIIEVELNNGIIKQAKFDLLAKPLEAIPLWDNAKYYTIYIRLLV